MKKIQSSKALCLPRTPYPLQTFWWSFMFLLSPTPFSLFKKLIFIGVELLHNVVLVSTGYQSISTLCIYIPPFLMCFPLWWPQSTELTCMFSVVTYFIHRRRQWHPAPVLLPGKFYTCVYVNFNLPVLSTLPSPLSIHKFVLYICVSISALQIRSSEPNLFPSPSPN